MLIEGKPRPIKKLVAGLTLGLAVLSGCGPTVDGGQPQKGSPTGPDSSPSAGVGDIGGAAGRKAAENAGQLPPSPNAAARRTTDQPKTTPLPPSAFRRG
jgi:hypothetical protein